MWGPICQYDLAKKCQINWGQNVKLIWGSKMVSMDAVWLLDSLEEMTPRV